MLTAFALLLGSPDISCNLSGTYTGNAISPTFALKVGGPLKREWVYTSSDDMFGLRKPLTTEHRGTYEFDGDLVVFTGTRADDPTQTVRFGLNYGFPGGKVAFDRLLPDGKGGFSYARKWFRKKGNGWQPAEEWWLTTALPGDVSKSFELHWKGRRTRWDADGKRTENAVDTKLRYKQDSYSWYSPENPAEKKWEWLPGGLIFEWSADGKVVVAVTWPNRSIGDLNGFHPGADSLPPP